MLDNCVSVGLYKIFGVSSSNTNSTRQYLDLPKLHVLIEMRKVKFMEKLHLISDFNPFATSDVYMRQLFHCLQ